MSENHHIGLRPVLSDAAPKNGITTIIASCPMSTTVEPDDSDSPIVSFRYVG
ncbi:Uncharacterised protein [Mycobacteroides abscessus subsp. abscessus]|nr:Uncharacterised protein [Mycobacteroides abscessus subsp. abscessus]